MSTPHPAPQLKVLQNQFPKYATGDLPSEYLPLNEQNISPNEKFGPLPFSISQSSHQHHSEYLSHCNPESIEGPHLYPFEFWPLPRVMSQWKFGRLNEVISIRADRVVPACPVGTQRLIGETTVTSISRRKGLCFGFFRSITRTESGDACMLAEDVLLLANGCDLSSLHDAVAEISNSRSEALIESPASILGSWILRMRYKWPENLWVNNIHTNSYARSLGYEGGLIEGPAVADVVSSYDRAQRRNPIAFQMSWKYAGPLYEGTPVVLISKSSNNEETRRYTVCEAPRQFPSFCRVLVNVEVRDR
jgi:hypothetical protein